MSNYFGKFPKIPYDINRVPNSSEYQAVTNIFLRMRMVREVLNNLSAYFVYLITEGDKPEILAEKLYKDPEAHWMILYANDIIDPVSQWPLGYNDFNNYVANKYGSIALSQTTYHHYEKIITRLDNATQTTTIQRIIIDAASQATTTTPYDNYTDMASSTVTTYVVNGKSVKETITKSAISNYDYELEVNEAKRQIKIIKPEYYGYILNQFDNYTGASKIPYIRGVL
jgi:hypothetical protein